MAYQLPSRIAGLKPYSYQKEGFICRLDINESFLQPPDSVRQAIARRVAELSLSEYPDAYANAVRALLSAKYGPDVDEIVVSNGSDELISLIIGRLLSAGDTILTTYMDFGGYEGCAHIFDNRFTTIPRDDDMFWHADDLIAAIHREKPALVIFSTPSNPVGRVVPKADVLRIVEAAPDSLVVVDEAYMEFAGDESVMNEVKRYPNLIVIKTLSKAYGLAGIRIGFAVANRDLATAMHAVRDVYNVSALSQIAAEEVLKCPEHLDNSVKAMRRTTDLLYEGLTAMAGHKSDIVKVYPSEANFLLVKLRDAPAVKRAVAEQGIALRLFDDNLIRISAASQAHTELLLQIFADCLK